MLGSKICCVILHTVLSKCNVGIIQIQLFLLKNFLALQSFATHHLCETIDSLFSKLQTACLKDYQPLSYKLPTSATLIMSCLMIGAL